MQIAYVYHDDSKFMVLIIMFIKSESKLELTHLHQFVCITRRIGTSPLRLGDYNIDDLNFSSRLVL